MVFALSRIGKGSGPCLSFVKYSSVLQEPDRVIPGGFLYMSDILYDWHIASRLGEIFMTRFADRNPDYIMTVETKGIPLAVMVARAFNKPPCYCAP